MTETSRVDYSCSACVYFCVFLSEYCMEHWKEDWFFGYQCMNGCNPRMIQRCKKLPENFPVTPDMVQSSMAPRTNLDKELKVKKIALHLSVQSIQTLVWHHTFCSCKIVSFMSIIQSSLCSLLTFFLISCFSAI